jgi:23S rRNA (cytidine1920-2'-O)/16S rRNA (cytidine1409-2'-O)-methyltransferase
MRGHNTYFCRNRYCVPAFPAVWYKNRVMKKRVDLLLVERGQAETQQKAHGLLLAGQVLVGEQKVTKAGQMVDADAEIRILGQLPFVSRAGGKLLGALEYFRIPVAGRICADLGASTGGFTDCLLQNGAREVHTFDVGRGQLAWKLQSDARVTVRDGFNVRNISSDDLPERISLVVADLSFISLTKILEPLRAALIDKFSQQPQGGTDPIDIVVLVKPQFEVGRGDVGKGGIVRDAEKQLEAVGSVEFYAREAGYRVVGHMASPVIGAGGNQEFLLYLQLPMGVLSSP